MCSKKSKGSKESVSKAMQTLIESTPQSVKEAVIYKWLRYQKHVFLTRVMIFRKTLLLWGFPDKECYLTFKIKALENRLNKTRQVANIF